MKINSKLKVLLKSILSLELGELAGLLFDGAMLSVGMEVFVKGADDELIPAPDGEYESEDGRIIIVKDGLVAEIKDPNIEEAPEETPEETTEIVAEAEEINAPEAEPADAEEVEDAMSLEDRVAALEGKLPEFVEGVKQILAAMAELENRLAEVEGKLAKVETEPAADAVEEEALEDEKPRSRMSYLRK